MPLDAGSVYATLGGKFNPAGFLAYGKAMDEAKGKTVKAEAEMSAAHKRSSGALSAMGSTARTAAAGGILAVGAAVASSVSKAATFEAQLSSLKSVSGATGRQMDQLKQQALDAGAATKYSALDAAKAQTELAKGGLTLKDIMGGGLKAALALAAAGELDLSDAAATTVNAMKLFGIEGKNAGHVADALATAANATTADVSDFALALTQGGSAAKAAGLSFDETIVALEALAQNGVKGSDAGTSLKTALLQIAHPTDESAKAMERLNLHFFDAKGNLKSLPAIADNLRESLGGLTRQQRTAALQTIAGTDGFRALLALYDQGPQKLRKLADGVQEQGTAAEVAKEKQDNLKGSMENLSGTVETLQIKLGQKLTPALRDAADATNKFLQEMDSGKGSGGAFARDLQDAGKTVADLGDALNDLGATDITFGSTKGLFDVFAGGAKSVAGALHTVKALLTGDLPGALSGLKQIGSGVFQNIAGAARLATSPIRGLGKALGVDVLAPFRTATDKLLGLFSSIIDAAAKMAGGLSKLPFAGGLFKGAKRGAEEARDAIDSLREKIRGVPSQKKVDVVADYQDAQAALKRIQGTKIERKVVKILGSDDDAKSKIQRLRALGIPKKDAVVLGKVGDALAGIGSVRAALASLHDREVHLTVIRTAVEKTVRVLESGNAKPLPKTRPRAAGRGRDGVEAAIVGDMMGGGSQRELVVDGRTGASMWVDHPTPMLLGADDYVIPTDPRFAGRALGLMLDLWQSMGARRYALGKKGKGKATKPLPIPDRITFAAVPEDDLTHTRDEARKKYTDKRDRINKAEQDVRDAKDKKGKAGKTARENAAKKLAKAKAGKSLGTLRAEYRELDREVQALHAANVEIDTLDTQQQTERTKMETAAKRGDAKEWQAAKGRRENILKQLRDKYGRALGLAKPGTKFAADLESKLAQAAGDLVDLGADTFTVDSPYDDSGLTQAERDRRDQIDAAVALAAVLTPTDLSDDTQAARDKVSFYESLLGSAIADPSRGGASVIAALADQVKSARGDLASLTTGGATNSNPDLQAQIDQQRARADAAERDRDVNAQALAVFKGAGDIGGPGFVQNNYMLTPSDPRVLQTVGDAAAAGFALQPYTQSPRKPVGIR